MRANCPVGFDLVSIASTMFFVMVVVLQFTTTEIAYSDFQHPVAAEQVADLEVAPTRITGTLKIPGATGC